MRLMILALLFSFAVACGKAEKNVEKEDAPTLVTVRKAKAETREIRRKYSGYAHPFESHGVGFLVAGRITSLPVEEGDFVKKGELLATIDSSDYELVKRLAESQLDALEPNFKRVDAMVKKNVMPQAKLDEIRGRYHAALTQKEQAERQIRYTRLYAPTGGVVHELRTSVGQVIGQGSAAVVLLDISKLKVKFGVPQADLAHFHVGDEAVVRFDGVDGEYKGRIFHVDFVADAYTRTYAVTVEVDNPENRIRPSMLAHTEIVQERIEAVFLPISAVMRSREGKREVMLYDETTGAVSLRPVETGRRVGEELEIVKGLSGGESVVVKGNNYASAGDKVVVK